MNQNQLAESIGTILSQKLDKRFDEQGKQFKLVRKDIRKLKEKVNDVIEVFDKDIVHLKKRTNRIETHLDLPPLPMEY